MLQTAATQRSILASWKKLTEQARKRLAQIAEQLAGAGRLLLSAANGTLPRAVLAAWLRRAAAGRAQLLANSFGGAVWGVFRENANCGDPPG